MLGARGVGAVVLSAALPSIHMTDTPYTTHTHIYIYLCIYIYTSLQLILRMREIALCVLVSVALKINDILCHNNYTRVPCERNRFPRQ